MTVLIQRAFASGELSPSLYARADFFRYQTGLRTLRNNIVLKSGGSANRPGTQFIGEVKYSALRTRLIEFEFSNTDTFMLEFGEEYIRFIKEGQYISDLSLTITGITNTDPAVLSYTGTDPANGDEFYISGVTGMTEVNNRNFVVANVNTGANTFELQYLDATDVDATGFGTYSSGGTADRIYEIGTPYQEDELFDLKYTQSLDVLTIVHPSHAPRDLSRVADDDWGLSEKITYEAFPLIVGVANAPNNIQLSSVTAGSNVYAYTVTAEDLTTGSVSTAGFSANISTAAPHFTYGATTTITVASSQNWAIGDRIYIFESIAIPESIWGVHVVIGVTSTTVTINVDTTGTPAYGFGSVAIYTSPVRIINAAVPTPSDPHTISFSHTSIVGDGPYKFYIYRDDGVGMGLIGTTTQNTFNDVGLTPDLSVAPAVIDRIFFEAGNYPSVVGYYQQRLVYASTTNNREKIWFSATNDFSVFNSTTTNADDSFNFSLAGRKLSEIVNILDLNKLIMFTSSSEQVINGDQAGIVSPTSINISTYSYNGSNKALTPIAINDVGMYVQGRGNVVRSIGFDYTVDGYRGDDLTTFSYHLFENHSIVSWDYQQVPNSILWCVRDDGVLLGLTYIKEQEILAWHRHDFDGGLVKSVSVISEGAEDVLYLIIEREVNNRTVQYVERMVSRYVEQAEMVNMKFMDSHLTYDGTNTTATTMTISGGTTWADDEPLTLTASASFFNSADVGNGIFIYDANGDLVIKYIIQSYSSATVVTVLSDRTVPVAQRGVATILWAKAVDEVTGLWHLEGKDVSVFADGFVEASPYNDDYDTITVTDGAITLDEPKAVIHIGLPYISDIETLDIEIPNGETMVDKMKKIGAVNIQVEKSRGAFIGGSDPGDNTLTGLTEVKVRNEEGYDEPVALKTGTLSVVIESEWNSNGRVFIRQVDPLPLSILSIAPAGDIPFRG